MQKPESSISQIQQVLHFCYCLLPSQVRLIAAQTDTNLQTVIFALALDVFKHSPDAISVVSTRPQHSKVLHLITELSVIAAEDCVQQPF